MSANVQKNIFREEEDGFSYKAMLERDERRWKASDRENKGYLTKEDLTAFLHPEEYDHMKELVILETIEDIDKDGDGKIGLSEYIGGKLKTKIMASIGHLWPNLVGPSQSWPVLVGPGQFQLRLADLVGSDRPKSALASFGRP